MKKLILILLIVSPLYSQDNRSPPDILTLMWSCDKLVTPIYGYRVAAVFFAEMAAVAHGMGANIGLNGYWDDTIKERIFDLKQWYPEISTIDSMLFNGLSGTDMWLIISCIPGVSMSSSRIHELYMWYVRNIDYWITPEGHINWGGK